MNFVSTGESGGGKQLLHLTHQYSLTIEQCLQVALRSQNQSFWVMPEAPLDIDDESKIRTGLVKIVKFSLFQMH